MRHIAPYLNLFADSARFFKFPGHIVILEIGVARGMSTRYFLKGLELRVLKGGTADLHSIDIQDCSKNVPKSPGKSDWNFICHDSTSLVWDKEVDILFIDGDHSYEGVKADFEKYVPFVKKGGLIYMHDVNHHRYGVKKFWDKLTGFDKTNLALADTGLGIINKK